FHGASVNVTALPFAPYWSVEEAEGAAGGAPPLSSYSGTDFLMLTTIAETLNFSVNVLPTKDWGEVTQLVEQRVSFMAPIIYAPVLRPRWQSLYYPLSDLVWLCALVVLLLMPPTFSMKVTVRRVVFFCVFARAKEFKTSHINPSKPITIATTSSRPTSLQIGRVDGRGVGGNTGVAFGVVGTLLGQSLNQLHSHSNAARLLLGAWLIFAFILGTAYRGNLTAALTLPMYPPRPETLQELVKAVKRVTMPTYGAQFRDFYMQSDSEVFRTLARIMEIVPSAEEGLRQASENREQTPPFSTYHPPGSLTPFLATNLPTPPNRLPTHQNNQSPPPPFLNDHHTHPTKQNLTPPLPLPPTTQPTESNPPRPPPPHLPPYQTNLIPLSPSPPTTSPRQAHIQARRYLELVVAEGFTRADGSTRLYLGRESVFPGLSAWPVPHDAPYKARLDRCIMAVKEAGLYEKWSRDLMEKARKEGRERQQRILRERRQQEGQADGQQDAEKPPEPSGNSPQALTIVHLQGPLMLAALGLGAASVTFLGEMAAARWL
ncbi:Variant Ionotropic Glutamate Receptor, partial [Penaeus vannamei]